MRNHIELVTIQPLLFYLGLLIVNLGTVVDSDVVDAVLSAPPFAVVVAAVDAVDSPAVSGAAVAAFKSSCGKHILLFETILLLHERIIPQGP